MSWAANVGFDLDLTLVDTRRATQAAAARINEVLGVCIDLDVFAASIGLPIREHLARWVPEPQLDDAVSEFRATFLGPGARMLVPTAGAHDALMLTRSLGGRAAVITSRLPHIAEGMLAACDLTADSLFGGVTGLEKAAAMRQAQISCYVGDHPLDMVGAQAAEVCGVGVLTGFHSAMALQEAGASVIIADLTRLNEKIIGHGTRIG